MLNYSIFAIKILYHQSCLYYDKILTFQICQQCVARIRLQFCGKFYLTNSYEVKTNTSVMNEVADGQKCWLISLRIQSMITVLIARHMTDRSLTNNYLIS